MREYSCKFSAYFDNLLCSIIQVCESIETENYSQNLVFTRFNCKGIKASLFYSVLDMYSPIRKRVLVLFLCLSITVYILGMSVQLIMQRDELLELHMIIHVFITIFLCALPKLLFLKMNTSDSEQNQRLKREELRNFVMRCLCDDSDDDSVIVN